VNERSDFENVTEVELSRTEEHDKRRNHPAEDNHKMQRYGNGHSDSMLAVFSHSFLKVAKEQ
jgi:hypothetical protein